MKKTLFSILLFESLTFNSQVIFKQDFSTLNLGPLNGQNSWTNNSSSGGTGGLISGAENVNVSAVTLSYPNYGNATKAITSKQVDQDGPGHLLPSAINSGTYYFSFLGNFSAYPTGTSYYDIIRMLNGSAFTTSARVWIQPGSTATGFKVGIKIGDSISPAAITLSDYAFNQTHLFVVKYTINPSTADDVMTLYIDPVFANGEPTVPTLVAPVSNNEYNNNIDRVAFPYNTPKAGKAVGNIGLLNIAKSWAELAFPETMGTSETYKSQHFLKVFYKDQVLNISQKGFNNEPIQIFSIDGKLISQLKLNSDATQNIPMQPLQKGVYLIKNKNYSTKLIVN